MGLDHTRVAFKLHDKDHTTSTGHIKYCVECFTDGKCESREKKNRKYQLNTSQLSTQHALTRVSNINLQCLCHFQFYSSEME